MSGPDETATTAGTAVLSSQPDANAPGTAMPMRLGPQPGEGIDRSRELAFSWNGRPFTAFEGDTIVSALAAAGERVFSRSLKYHRPRGLLTASFHDPGCIVQVGDEPNVRGAHRLVSAGLQVSSQDTWPSLRFDAKAANRLAGRFLTAGFYYKTFMRPRFLWPQYENVLRRFTHGGSVSPQTPHIRQDKRFAHPDVLVAGGGPAGLAAALAAAAAGASVLLVEEEHDLGGHLRWGGEEELAGLARLRAELAGEPGIEVLTNSVVLGRYDGNWLAVLERSADGSERLIKARAKTLIVAPGLIERPYVIEGNDLPGVMLSTAVRRLINLYAVRPGQRAVVLTANPQGDAAIADLRRAGVEIAQVEDARRGGDVVAVRGRSGVRSVEVADGTKIDCDLLVTAVGWTAPTLLINAAGNRPVYSERAARFLPDLTGLPADVLVAGGIAGDGTLEELTGHAAAVGREAARRAAAIRRAVVAATPTASIADRGDRAEFDPVPIPRLDVDEHPELFAGRTSGFVDFSEDVTTKDLTAAIAEGFDSAELVKRFTTATMGPAQGKLETINTVAIVAGATGQPIADAGTTTWRPPYVPVTLAALAGRSFEPVRYSPMQPWHEAHGAVPLQAGAWIRPDHYGNPAAEARNVRENVGIIDVTPIGKLDLRGPDVSRLLNLLYVNKWSKLVSAAQAIMTGSEVARGRPKASLACAAKYGPVLRTPICVSNPLRRPEPAVDSEPSDRPAKTVQEATSVAPFQLAYMIAPPSARRTAMDGRSVGWPFHSLENARYDCAPDAIVPSRSSRPSGRNSEKRGCAPQPTNMPPSGSVCALPAVAANTVPGWTYALRSVTCMAAVSTCRISALECLSLAGLPLSKTVSLPWLCARAWCCQENLLPGPMLKSDFLPPIRQTMEPFFLLTL